MKKLLFLLFTVLSQLCAVHCANAQTGLLGGPLSYHVWFDAIGWEANLDWGCTSLSALPAINDSTPHPLAIGEFDNDAGFGPPISNYALNRYPLDTGSIYQFPGTIVVPGNFNGDQYTDFVCIGEAYNGEYEIVTILYGTAKPDSFVTAAVLYEDPESFGRTNVAVCDCNSDGYDDLILSERGYRGGGEDPIGAVKYFRGGPGMAFDTLPAQTIVGADKYHVIGGQVQIGKIHDTKHTYLLEERGITPPLPIVEYLIQPNFTLIPTDTIYLNSDSGFNFGPGYLVTEATGNSLDDILITAGGSEVLIYAGADTISPNFTYRLSNKPFDPESPIGDMLLNVGDVSGHGYNYLLVTGPGALGYDGGSGGGDIYLYPMQAGLKDTCVAWAGIKDLNSELGITAAAMGDMNGDGLADFYCGANNYNGGGRLIAFLGDSSYGVAITAVKEPVVQYENFTLKQNYPNPFSSETNISFSISDSRLWGKQATLKIYNALGAEVYTAFNQKADGANYTIQINAGGLPEGNYFYRLSCGGMVSTKMFMVFR